jgi:hypothetical protein
MKYNLFLDDIRDPKDAFGYTNQSAYIKLEWKIVRNFNQFVEMIENNYYEHNVLPKMISFDHDLADHHYAPPEHWHRYNEWGEEQNFKEKTGYDCAKWLVNFCLDHNLHLPVCLVHSMNITGAENIVALLNNFIKFQNTEYSN